MVLFSKKSKAPGECTDDDEGFPNPMLHFSNQLNKRTVFVKKMNLATINDIQSIQTEIDSGNITIIDVSGFITSGEFTVLELKRAVEQIRGTCKKLGGALARLGDRYIVATPNEHVQLEA
nr:cell division protein SepF [Candidatus Sigynarchaeota archaeon]